MDAAMTDLRRQLFGDFEQTEFPESGPLDVAILYRRSYFDYDEWKIEYDVQSPDSMPVEAGRRIPAYLLVPNRGEPWKSMMEDRHSGARARATDRFPGPLHREAVRCFAKCIRSWRSTMQSWCGRVPQSA